MDPGGHPPGPEDAGRWMHHQATTASPDQEYLVGGGTGGGSTYNHNILFSYEHCIIAVTLVLEPIHLLQSVYIHHLLAIVKNGRLLSKPYRCTVPPVSTISQHSQRKR